MNIIFPVQITLYIAAEPLKKENFEYIMSLIENAVISQVKNSYFEIELRHLVHSSDTECLFKDIISQKAGEKITIKVLSNVNPMIITSESKVPHSTLDLNGNFHSKIYVNITDTP